MSSRLPPLPQSEWDDDAMSVLTLGQQVKPSNALGLFAHHPALTKAFLTLNMHLLGKSTLPKKTRELLILRVAWRRDCEYEWAEHVKIGRRRGITDAELDEIREGAPTLLNRAVDELETTFNLTDELYAELSAEFDDRQMMDLVFTVGTYGTLATAFNTFQVRSDPEDEAADDRESLPAQK